MQYTGRDSLGLFTLRTNASASVKDSTDAQTGIIVVHDAIHIKHCPSSGPVVDKILNEPVWSHSH